MTSAIPSRAELADRYLAQLPYTPYAVQEEALLAWFMAEQGVMVCAPTGTGKTPIAQAALFEALHTGSVAYYTTPLIAHAIQVARLQPAFDALGIHIDAEECSSVHGGCQGLSAPQPGTDNQTTGERRA